MKNYQKVKFFFETSNGPGEVTVAIGSDTTVEEAEQQLLEVFTPLYKEIKVLAHILIDD